MYKFKGLALIAALGLMTAAPQTATAETKIYPYKTHENYCPQAYSPCPSTV